ncbi:hypothetical protein [Akkermansia phage Chantilly]|nr:hypothetical protein [Akkermansia phage Chantilly]
MMDFSKPVVFSVLLSQSLKLWEAFLRFVFIRVLLFRSLLGRG